MLSPLPRHSNWCTALLNHPVVSAFPEMAVGSACATSFSRLAQRSLTLRPAHSRCHRILRHASPEASTISLPPQLLRLLPAGAVAGWDFHPLGKRRLFTAHARSGSPSCERKASYTRGTAIQRRLTYGAHPLWPPSQRRLKPATLPTLSPDATSGSQAGRRMLTLLCIPACDPVDQSEKKILGRCDRHNHLQYATVNAEIGSVVMH